MEFEKPQRLVEGDTVAVVSPSWGGPDAYPEIYEKGILQLNSLGLRVKEYPTTRMSADDLYRNPKLRARDISEAFADPNIKAIIASIGGDDSVRLLNHLDWDSIKDNAKIILGYSDTTALLAAINFNGLVTFHGPCVMAGFAQIDAFPGWRKHIEELLFRNPDSYQYEAFATYADGYPDWAELGTLGDVSPERPSAGWHWLQGEGASTGTLFGGCIEVLEFIKGTEFWPTPEFWNEKILFFETSEEKPSLTQVKRMLRNYGSQGVFERASALMFGRARDYTDQEKESLDSAILDVVAGEFESSTLQIVTNMDFGHTDPQHILPLGVRAQLDRPSREFRLVEAALAART